MAAISHIKGPRMTSSPRWVDNNVLSCFGRFRTPNTRPVSHHERVDVIAILEGVEQHAGEGSRAVRRHATRPGVDTAAAGVHGNEPLYKALLAIIIRLSTAAAAASPVHQQHNSHHHHQHQQQQQEEERPSQQQWEQQPQPSQPQHKPPPHQQQQQQLEAFLRAQPVATSIPFISWLADLEAKSRGAQKAQLAALCEALLVHREQRDRQQQEELYQDTVNLLAGGNEQVTSLLSSEPQHYALALAEGLTGQPVVLQGYSPAYDVLLQAAPAAALTPASIAQGHQLAAELGRDLTSRRKSTLAAMLGRTQLNPQQQTQLMGPSPAARICDLLLTLSSSEERITLLPDCFTPPDDTHQAAGANGESSSDQQQQQQQHGEEEETEDLWCTPLQLLNEIELRLKAAVQVPQQQQQQQQQLQQPDIYGKMLSASWASHQQQEQNLLPGPGVHSMSEAAELSALQELRDVIKAQWLESLPMA